MFLPYARVANQYNLTRVQYFSLYTLLLPVKNPPLNEHRLAKTYTHSGASVALHSNFKPDELEEALQYYRMLALQSRSYACIAKSISRTRLGCCLYNIANFYYNGYRGVKQDLRLALKYYEICGEQPLGGRGRGWFDARLGHRHGTGGT